MLFIIDKSRIKFKKSGFENKNITKIATECNSVTYDLAIVN